MTNFKTFFLEQETQDAQQRQAQAVAAKVKTLLSDKNIAAVVAKYKVKDIDSLIAQLKKHPEVQKKIQAYQKTKSQKMENTLDEGVWDVLGKIWEYTVGPVLSWLKQSVAKTFGHIFGAFLTDAAFGQKALYAGMLIAMIGVPIALLMSGGAAAIGTAGSALALGGGTFFGMMWFGKNFIEPLMKMSEGIPSGAQATW